VKTRKKTVEPRTEAQKAYVRALFENELAFGIGPAGTGKTYLAVAVGSEANTFGEDAILERVFTLDTFAEASAMRAHVIAQARNANCEAARTAVIVGAGETGQDAAKGLSKLAKKARLSLDIIVIASGKKNKKLAKLEKKYGVRTITNTRASLDCDGVRLSDGRTIPAATICWSPGIQGRPLLKRSGIPVTSNGRVLVDKNLNASGVSDRVFFAGDIAVDADRSATVKTAERHGKRLGSLIRAQQESS
ncbi:MAG: FAD-dependent oxidoreductase, partial [Myxococcota bacterium]